MRTIRGEITSFSAAARLLAAVCGALTLLVTPSLAGGHPSPTDVTSPLGKRQLSADGSSAPTSPTHPSPAARAGGSGVRLERCEEAPGGRCGIVRVPLDRADPSRRKIPIFFEYYRSRGKRPADKALIVTLGGPGASITQDPFVSDFYRDIFEPLLDRRDLIFLDQRGVGRSGAINCGDLQHGPEDLAAAVAACGEQLGPAASLYGSGDVARDIDAVRRALGLERLDFYGGSYSAMDIQAYALRFGDHLRSAVLDAPAVPALGPYDFDATTVGAMNRAIQLLCARSRSCVAERPDALDSVAWLAAHLRTQPLTGTGYDAAGEPHDLQVTESFLLWRPLLSDLGGFVALSEVGAAADALQAGDPAPLLRLAAEADGPLYPDEGNPTVYSVGDGEARFCTDAVQPWDKSAPLEARLASFEAARAALPADAFAPFSVDAWLAPAPIGLLAPDPCIRWPAPARPVPPAVPPDATFPESVPALILDGDLDSVTPSADARALSAAWPGSRFIEIPNAGHHTIFWRSGCVSGIVLRFIAKRKPGPARCARHTGLISFPGVGRFPRTAAGAAEASVDPAATDQSTAADRQVAAVASATVTDAVRHAFLQDEPGRGVGLRGGTFKPKFGESSASVKLKEARFAEDVAVSGRASYPFDTEALDAKVTVDGPGDEDGRLRIRGVWFGFRNPTTVLRIRGTLAGRQLSLQVPAS